MQSKAKCLLCCFNVCVLCGCRDQLISKNAFYPPECSYDLVPQNSNDGSLNQYEFIFKTFDESGEQKLPQIDDIKVTGYKIKAHANQLDYFIFGQQEMGEKTIPVVHIKFLDKLRHRNLVLLHSHANSTDMGYMMDMYLDLAFNLRVDIIGYDYSGYGIAQHTKPSDKEIIQNVLSVYKFVIEGLKYPWNEIILYGQSLGTGPSTLLASLKEKPVGGLILHSAFSSGLRAIFQDSNPNEDHSKNILSNLEITTISPSLSYSSPQSPVLTTSMYSQESSQMDKPQMTSQFSGQSDLHKYDFFPNYQLIRYVNCPIFIMHGDSDTIIPLSHMQQLLCNIKSTTPYLKQVFQGAGHNNIESDDKFRKEYYHRLRQFLTSVSSLQKGKQATDLLQQMQASYWENFNHIYLQQIQNINKFQEIRTQNTSQSQVSINLVESSHYSQSSNNPSQDRGSSHLSSFSFNPQKKQSNFSNQHLSISENQQQQREKKDNQNRNQLIEEKQLSFGANQIEFDTATIQNELDTPTNLTENNLNSQTLLTDEGDNSKQLKQDLLQQ